MARKYDIAHSIVGKWVRKTRGNGVNGAGRTAPKIPQDHKELMVENEQLKKLLGKKELEIEILRDLLKKT